MRTPVYILIALFYAIDGVPAAPQYWWLSVFDDYILNLNFTFQGADNWAHHFPKCGLKHQSPINLLSKKAKKIVFDWDRSIVTYGFNQKQGMSYVLNAGHTITVYLNGADWKIAGGILLMETYRVHKMEFRFGVDNTVGSEHHIDGKAYPLEVQLVLNFHEGTGSAVRYSMISILMEDRDGTDNVALRPFTDAARCTRFKGEANRVNAIRLADLLPKRSGYYYSYNGSFTGPPCSAGVRWIVFDDIAQVSTKQLNILRNLYRVTMKEYYTGVRRLNATVDEIKNYGSIGNVFRPVQRLEDRSIYYVSLPANGSGVNRPTTRNNVILWLLLMLCKVYN